MMAKAKDSRRLTATVISSMCLIMFPLIYALLFPLDVSQFDYWKQISIWGSSGGDGASLSESNMENGRLEDTGSLKFLLRRLVRGRDRTELETTGFACKSDLITDVCVANQLVRLDTHWQNTRSLVVYLSSNDSSQPQPLPQPRSVKPYARKNDPSAMRFVKPVEIQTLKPPNATATQGQKQPRACDVNHNVPAVVFSSGGYTGNIFHEINDIILPLFITARQFRSQLRFVVTDYKMTWVNKYHQVLSQLSDYEIINPIRDGRVHCFPGAVIGLNYHDNLACNVSELPVGCVTMDFKRFLHNAFHLKFMNVDLTKEKKPLFLLLSRQNSRRFLNEDEMVKVADELGFRVKVALPNETTNLEEFAEVVNSCSVMVGAHGAGLTNAVFLPTEAVLVQVVPLGLEFLSNVYYGRTFVPMGIRYLEYKIRPEESTLLEVYGSDHPIITDPTSIHRKGYLTARKVYLSGQDMKLMPLRFRETLVKALRLLGR